VADIKVKGIHRIKVKMVSEGDHYGSLDPMKTGMLAYFAQKIVASTTHEDLARASEKTKKLIEEFTGIKPDEIKEKTDRVSYFFEDEIIRKEFFHGLKKMNIIHWWVSWKRWQKNVCRHHTLTIFILLWAFNYDGFKKKTTRLLEKVSSIYATIRSQSPIESNSSTNFDTFQKTYLEAHEKLVKQSMSSSNN